MATGGENEGTKLNEVFPAGTGGALIKYLALDLDLS